MILKFITTNTTDDPAIFETETLFEQELGFTENIDGTMDILKDRFDSRECVSYLIEFNEGVQVAQTHNLENIRRSDLKQLTIKIK